MERWTNKLWKSDSGYFNPFVVFHESELTLMLIVQTNTTIAALNEYSLIYSMNLLVGPRYEKYTCIT